MPLTEVDPPAFDARLTPARRDIAAAHLAGAVRAARFVEGIEREVVAPLAPVRREPQSDGRLLTEALRGERVTVYDEEEGWSWGQLAADGYVGYLATQALGPPGAGAPTHKVAVLRAPVYPGPDIKLAALGALPFGARVVTQGTEGRFTRIAEGFVWAGHLASVDDVEPDFVAVAERFLGVPYLWGGKTALGLDCSGLVQVALGAAGVAAPRDSDMQERALGDPLAEGAPLRRGDLVFWRGHVAILRDPVTILHASGDAMLVASEPLDGARARIAAAGGGPVTSVRRLGAARDARPPLRGATLR